MSDAPQPRDYLVHVRIIPPYGGFNDSTRQIRAFDAKDAATQAAIEMGGQNPGAIVKIMKIDPDVRQP